MNIQSFLEHHGIARNPFAEEDAQTDQVFKEHCISSAYHPIWDKVYGDPIEPSTAMIFGPKGSGKTAIRLQIDRHLQQFNKDNPKKRVFIIRYDDFNPFLDHFCERMSKRTTRKPEKVLDAWKLWDHMDAILCLGVTNLVDQILDSGNKGSDSPIARADLKKLDRTAARDMLLLASSYDQSTDASFSSRWKSLRKKLRYGNFTAKRSRWFAILWTLFVVGLFALLFLRPVAPSPAAPDAVEARAHASEVYLVSLLQDEESDKQDDSEAENEEPSDDADEPEAATDEVKEEAASDEVKDEAANSESAEGETGEEKAAAKESDSADSDSKDSDSAAKDDMADDEPAKQEPSEQVASAKVDEATQVDEEAESSTPATATSQQVEKAKPATGVATKSLADRFTAANKWLDSVFGNQRPSAKWLWLAPLLILLGALPYLIRLFKCHVLANGIRKHMRVGKRETSSIRRVLQRIPAKEMASQPLPRFERTDDRYELLQKFQSVLEQLGYTGTIVLMDRVDEPHMTGGKPELMRRFVWPLLDNKLLKHPGLGFKMMLPQELHRDMERESREFHERARLDKQNVIPAFEWTGESLYDLSRARMMACAADGKTMEPKNLFADELDYQRLLSAFQSLRVPRHLFRFLYRVLVDHCNRYTDAEPEFLIQPETFETVLAVYTREAGPSN